MTFIIISDFSIFSFQLFLIINTGSGRVLQNIKLATVAMLHVHLGIQ
jgi:hypothetical protein